MSEGDKKPLNKIIRETKGNKKFKVFVKDQSTKKIKLIRFGDANMSIKSNIPARKKSFNARMGGVLKKVKMPRNYHCGDE